MRPPPSAERVRSLFALELLEHLGTLETRAALRALAKGIPGAWPTEVARLARRSVAKP
jgi:hypothetical protein